MAWHDTPLNPLAHEIDNFLPGMRGFFLIDSVVTNYPDSVFKDRDVENDAIGISGFMQAAEQKASIPRGRKLS